MIFMSGGDQIPVMMVWETLPMVIQGDPELSSRGVGDEESLRKRTRDATDSSALYCSEIVAAVARCFGRRRRDGFRSPMDQWICRGPVSTAASG